MTPQQERIEIKAVSDALESIFHKVRPTKHLENLSPHEFADYLIAQVSDHPTKRHLTGIKFHPDTHTFFHP
jgi:hypothetical protein